ncbi:MAG: glycosyltransferase family 4 protein [Candidatus Hadarchaeota archaeon]
MGLEVKILFVTEYYPHDEITGGVEARAYHLSRRLAENHDVKVICSRQQGQPEESEVNGCEVHRVGREHPYSSEGDFLTRLSFVDAAIERGKELDADLVDAQSFLAYVPGHAIAEEIGAKRIATYHETWIGEWIENKGLITGIGGEFWERMSLDRDWDRIVSVSDFTRDRLAERGVDPGKVEVVPNGVDLSEFEDVGVEKGERPTICTVSRLTEKKRVDFVMRALERVSEEIPDASLRVVGDGPERADLEELSEGLDADIELLGYIPDREDVIEVMKESRVFVSASVLEGFGMSVLEAAASGTPYVVSDIPPHVEVTKGERGGMVFDRENLEDLSEKVVNLLKDDEFYSKKVGECGELAEEYDWGRIADKLEEVYRDALNEG